MSNATPPATIDFTCTRCNRLLRVPASAIGQQARCPQCGSVVTITDNRVASPVVPVESASVASPRGGQTAAQLDAEHQAAFPPAPAALPASMPSPAPAAPAPAANPVGVIGLSELAASSMSAAHRGAMSNVQSLFDRLRTEISKIYVGQDELVLGALVALFSGGHILIESVPGLGKTLFVRTLGRVLGCDFGRIQFTADLMPSDITGAPIFDMKQQEFRFRAGPVFTQLLLADEINRSPAKTHAALLEIMQEYRVTVDGTSHRIERPFLVLATQNPIESEGTYNLPEAQLDRFMFKLLVGYPEQAEEAAILRLHVMHADFDRRLTQDVQMVTNPKEILAVSDEVRTVRVDDRLIDYVNQLVRQTRRWPQFHIGASPRAGIALIHGAQTLAAFLGRDYAVPDDVASIALPALRHRVSLTAEAEVEGRRIDELLTEVIRSVEVPRL
jgi:MoxR-like ATPase